MQPHQERVVTEQADLQDKINKLYAFTVGGFFEKVDAAEQARLAKQLDQMIAYNHTLLERIDAFKAAA